MHVIATAGHIDHGKSTVVAALTGMEPDRWAEERHRGMTIDLGYVWTELAGGSPVAFVDVPGHRKFLTNALAGVGPAPAVLLVVASDEGWAQQTTEHVAALDALGVRHGVLALTRADLGDPDLAESEARDHLAGTSLAGIEAVAVSAVTGTGMDELRAALTRLTGSLPPPPPHPARLWVDRAFSVRGAGTVVTGTLTSGSLRVGDELEVVPGDGLVRIRGIETLKNPVTESDAVARVAVNLRGVKTSDVPRGSAMVAPDRWIATSTVDVRLVKAAKRLPTQVTLHIGSAAIAARLRPLAGDTARISLATAIPVRIGERALLRDPGQSGIAAGVIVLDAFPPPLARRRGSARRRGEELAAMTGEPDPATEIRLRGAVRREQLAKAGGLGDEVPANAEEVSGWLVERALWTRRRSGLLALADEWAAANPLRPGVPRARAAQQLGLPEVLLEALVQQEDELVLDGAGIHRKQVSATLPAEFEEALRLLLDHLAAHPFDALDVPELQARGLPQQLLDLAARRGDLLRLPGAVYLRPDAPEEAMARLGELPQPFTASEARQTLGTTRRVALPLLEELDRRRHTRRVDTRRRSVR